MFYRLPFLNPIQMIVSFANWKLLLMKWIEINPVTRMNQSIWTFIDFFSHFFLCFKQAKCCCILNRTMCTKPLPFPMESRIYLQNVWIYLYKKCDLSQQLYYLLQSFWYPKTLNLWPGRKYGLRMYLSRCTVNI